MTAADVTAGRSQRSLGSALPVLAWVLVWVLAWALACSSPTGNDIPHPGAADLQPVPVPVTDEERLVGEEDPVAAEAPMVAQGSREFDLEALAAGLRDTETLGFFTKLALKNEVDDLLDGLRGYHAERRGGSLKRLRERFDLLLLKVRTLLQDEDWALAAKLTAGREALWNQLADPVEFAQIFARVEER